MADVLVEAREALDLGIRLATTNRTHASRGERFMYAGQARAARVPPQDAPSP